MKFRHIQNSFLGGEVSPTALGRSDLPQYAHACKTLRNMVPMLSGGAYRRPGTFKQDSFVGTTDYAPRLIPFVVSETEAYCLIVNKVVGGAGYIKAIRATDNVSSASSGVATGAHPWNQASISSTGAGNSYDEWHDIKTAQSADVMYLAHPSQMPGILRRTAVDTFTLGSYVTGLSGATLRDSIPYRTQNITATTITPSGTSGLVVLTASSAIFDAKHVGAIIKIDHAGTYGAAVITVFTSSTSVNAVTIVNFGGTSAATGWWESSWSNYRGWPRTVGFFQDRLVFGGNTSEPDSLWFSKTSNYNVFSVASRVDPRSGPAGDEAFTRTLLSRELNLIQWISAGKTLLVGTLGDEWLIDRETTGGFGGDNILSLKQTSNGSAYIQPERVGDELIFCTTSQDELKSLVFNFQEDSYVAEPLQTFYDERPQVELPIVGNSKRYRAIGWDKTRSVLWCCDTRGNLFSMTRDRRLGVTAWASHQMGGYDSTETGGSLGSGGTLTTDPAYWNCSGSVLSLAVVPNPVMGTQDVWLAVKRKINGSFSYHIERIIGKNTPSDTAYSYPYGGSGTYFADSCVLYLGDYPLVETNSVTAAHLEGKALVGTAFNSNGIFKVTTNSVATGSCSIQSTYPTGYLPGSALVQNVFALGLPFTSTVTPVRIEAGSQIGSAQTAKKRIHEVFPRFYRTISAKIGRDADNLETIIFRDATSPIGKSPELFTGDKRIHMDSDYDRDGYITIVQDQPLPMTVISIVAEGATYD